MAQYDNNRYRSRVEESCIGVPFLLPSKGIVAILELQDKFMMSFPAIN